MQNLHTWHLKYHKVHSVTRENNLRCIHKSRKYIWYSIFSIKKLNYNYNKSAIFFITFFHILSIYVLCKALFLHNFYSLFKYNCLVSCVKYGSAVSSPCCFYIASRDLCKAMLSSKFMKSSLPEDSGLEHRMREYLVLLLAGQATVSHVDRPSVESYSCLRRDDTAGSRDIVFLPRHELRNKITTRNWNYPRITIALGVIVGCLCIDVYGSESSAPLTASEHAQVSADFLVCWEGPGECQTFCIQRTAKKRVVHTAMQFWTTDETRDRVGEYAN